MTDYVGYNSVSQPFLVRSTLAWFKNFFWQHPKLLYLLKKVSSSIFSGTLRASKGTKECRDTPVGNHCEITKNVDKALFGSKFTFDDDVSADLNLKKGNCATTQQYFS